MNTEIKIFTSDSFGKIRTCQVNNQIMFVGKDVATALGYSNARDALRKHVDTEDKGTVAIRDTAYETRVTVINESGLYSLILSSKLPQAKAFKRWVTNVVLPQIRKTGGYIPTTDAQCRQRTGRPRYARSPMADDRHGHGHRRERHHAAGLPEYAERVGDGNVLDYGSQVTRDNRSLTRSEPF